MAGACACEWGSTAAFHFSSQWNTPPPPRQPGLGTTAIHQATFYDVHDLETDSSIIVVRGTIDALDMLQGGGRAGSGGGGVASLKSQPSLSGKDPTHLP